jgi:hypothetical protein
MSGSMTPRADRSRQPWLYGAVGALLMLVVILAIVVVVLLGGSQGGNGNLVAATASPSAVPSAVALASSGFTEAPSASSEPSAGATPGATAGPIDGPTAAPASTAAAARTPAPTTHSTPKPTLAPSPTAATKPKIDSFTADPNFITTCDGSTSVRLTWTTTNADKVDIAVDPQGESPLQHIYLEYQALDGYVDVPYACTPPNTDPTTGDKYHEYVVIAHKGTAYVWKSIKVYIHPVT